MNFLPFPHQVGRIQTLRLSHAVEVTITDAPDALYDLLATDPRNGQSRLLPGNDLEATILMLTMLQVVATRQKQEVVRALPMN
ncbi:hypothetical protein [Spirosoma areae]